MSRVYQKPSMSILWLVFALPVLLPSVNAEEAKKQQADVIQSGWVSQCSSSTRKAEPDCSMENRILIKSTGQVFFSSTLQVLAKTREPVVVLRVPLGLDMSEGVAVKIDDSFTEKYRLQTCEQSGCYVQVKSPEKIISAMQKGKILRAVLKSNNGKEILISIGLDGFSDIYRDIK